MAVRTFGAVGFSTHRGNRKVRFTNNSENRLAVLSREGHIQVELYSLPQPMTKEQAVQFLLRLHSLDPANAAVALRTLEDMTDGHVR